MIGRKRARVLVARAPEKRAPDAGGLVAFDATARGEWCWRQPKWSKRAWTLEVDGAAVAELAGESVFSSLSRVRYAHAEYEVHRGWTGNAELRDTAGEPRARYRSRWSGDGRIETGDGATLELVAAGFWKRRYELRSSDELPLARFELEDQFVRQEARVVIEDGLRRRPDAAEVLALASAIVFAPKRHSS